MHTTDVTPEDLNYNTYSMRKYDRDIVNSIPYHAELHFALAQFIKKYFNKQQKVVVLDLGVGTGLTSKLLRQLLPNAEFEVVDFSRRMLVSAKVKLGMRNIRYIYGDYAKHKFNRKYDIVVSVIGVHHQTHAGKRRLFKKIYKLLKPGGVFIFGDLVTYSNKQKAALNQALHFHHLVEHSANNQTLTDWAHHHLFLNNLAPLEDQTGWLKAAGFKISLVFNKFNTALLICKK